MSGFSRDRSRALDVLRGTAILYVVVYHYCQLKVGLEATPIIFRMGWSGVDLFFVLSGFLLGGQLLDHRAAPNYFIVFYGRRAARILPLYVFFLEAVIPFFLAIGLTPPIWPLLTFTQNFLWSAAAADDNGPGGVIVTTWSLAVEEQFYLVLPLLLRRLAPPRLPYVIVALIVVAPLLRIGLELGWPRLPTASFYLMPCRMDALFAGVFCAWSLRNEAARRFVTSHRAWLAGAAAAAFGGHVWMAAAHMRPTFWQMWSIGYTWNAAMFSLVLLLAMTGPAAPRRIRPVLAPLVFCGWISYSAYLLHVPTIFAVTRLTAVMTPVLTAAALVILSALSWRWIEQPFIRASHRIWLYRRFEDGDAGLVPASLPRGPGGGRVSDDDHVSEPDESDGTGRQAPI